VVERSIQTNRYNVGSIPTGNGFSTVLAQQVEREAFKRSNPSVTSQSWVQAPQMVFFSTSRVMVHPLELASLNGSLLIQGITLLLNFASLGTPLQPADAILKEILGLETFVQIIELLFYSWYRATILENGASIMRFRYYDWFITTPIMLFSTLCFYVYLDYEEKNKKESPESQEPISVQSILSTYKWPILGMFGFNALMLLFGYLQEIHMISIGTSSIFGYLSLMGSFGILYTQFVTKVPNQGGLFYAMFFVWSLYGVAAMLPKLGKTISYNILDIFAKNFYGIFLSYIIWQKSTSVEPVPN